MSMRPYGGFTTTFENEGQAAEALAIVKKELAKNMPVWNESVTKSGNTISVDMKTDLGEAYDEETEQMAYRKGTESLLTICKEILKRNPESGFQLEAKIVDDEALFWADEQANAGSGEFAYKRSTQINFPDYDALEEYKADVDLDEVDPDDYSMLEAEMTVTGAYANGKWSFKKKQKCNVE